MIDLQLFKNIIAEGRHNGDLLDSYSPNQFKTKERLIGHVRDLNVVNDQSEITILGGWYGSILIPAFKEAKRISLIDMDKNAISIANKDCLVIIKMLIGLQAMYLMKKDMAE